MNSIDKRLINERYVECRWLSENVGWRNSFDEFLRIRFEFEFVINIELIYEDMLEEELFRRSDEI